MTSEAHRRRILPRFVAVLLLAAAACSPGPPPPPVRVASTTSIVDTGLAGSLSKRFFDETRIRMNINAVGSGQAFALGRRGEADLVLAHDPEALAAFRKDGFVAESLPFARNDFMLAGPPGDPAGTADAPSIAEALARIARAQAVFVSRGDGSGTNARELRLWKDAGLDREPDAAWYVKTGQGMAETLRVADEKGAYVLTDSATFATLAKRVRLRDLVDRGPDRGNVYVAIVVRDGGEVRAGARRFLAFLREERTRRYITSFGRSRTGAPLFTAP